MWHANSTDSPPTGVLNITSSVVEVNGNISVDKGVSVDEGTTLNVTGELSDVTHV